MSLTIKDVTWLESYLTQHNNKPDPVSFVQEFIEYKRGSYNSVHMSVSGLNELFGQVFPSKDIVAITDQMRAQNLVGKMPTSFRTRSGRTIFGYKIWNIDPNKPRVVTQNAVNTVDALIAKALGRTSETSRTQLVAMGIPEAKIQTLTESQCDTLLELAKAQQSSETPAPKKRASKKTS